MRRLKSVLCLLAVSAVFLSMAGSARADEQEYKIKLVRPQKVGDQYTTTVNATVKQSSKGNINGREMNTDESYVAEFVGKVKIEAVDDKYSLPTKFTCKVDHVTKDGKELYPAGTVISGEMVSKRPKYLIDGKPAAPKNVELLSIVLPLEQAESQALQDQLMGSDQPQKVGATWQADGKKIAKLMASSGLPVPADALKGQTTLVKVQKLNGEPFMELNAKLNSDGFKNDGPAGMTITDGTVDIETTVIVPVDETKPMISKTGKAHMHMTMNAPNGLGTATVDGDREVKEQHEAIEP
jgi:hypothetical protein